MFVDKKLREDVHALVKKSETTIRAVQDATDSSDQNSNKIDLVLSEIKELKEISKKINEQHNEFHDEMLEKLNKAGELIVNYENFYESTLQELDEIMRFLEILQKRPTVSSDPDYVNFQRAVQLMM
ncbi:MAG: hypothetical protein Q7K54_03055, partial [Candidatus Parcubacteria bacterium]|nr:hypothetical protein [Candidatus Parcubacteria bacterium]